MRYFRIGVCQFLNVTTCKSTNYKRYWNIINDEDNYNDDWKQIDFSLLNFICIGDNFIAENICFRANKQ